MDNIYKDYCTLCKTKDHLMGGYFTKSVPRKSDGVITFYRVCNPCNTARLKKYRATRNGKEKTYRARRDYIMRHKEKQFARYKVQYAVSSGKLVKPKHCERCGKQNELDGHHSNYDEPLVVDWLCRTCHATVHSKEYNN